MSTDHLDLTLRALSWLNLASEEIANAKQARGEPSSTYGALETEVSSLAYRMGLMSASGDTDRVSKSLQQLEALLAHSVAQAEDGVEEAELDRAVAHLSVVRELLLP